MLNKGVMSMDSIRTSDLEKMLENMSIEDYEKFQKGVFIRTYHSISDYFNEYMATHQLTLAQVIKKSQVPRNYAYAILNGHKTNPTRDRIIALALAMEMDLEATNNALKICNAGVLYPKVTRDALISICIHRKVFDVNEINEILTEHGEAPLKVSRES